MWPLPCLITAGTACSPSVTRLSMDSIKSEDTLGCSSTWMKEPRALQASEGTTRQLLNVASKPCSHHNCYYPGTPTCAVSCCIKLRHETGLVFLASVDFLPLCQRTWQVYPGGRETLRTTQRLCARLLPRASSECSRCRVPRPPGLGKLPAAGMTACHRVALVATHLGISLEDLLNSLPAHTWRSRAPLNLLRVRLGRCGVKLTYPDLRTCICSKGPDMQAKRVCLSFCCSDDDLPVGFLGGLPRELEADSEMWPCIPLRQPETLLRLQGHAVWRGSKNWLPSVSLRMPH